MTEESLISSNSQSQNESQSLCSNSALSHSQILLAGKALNILQVITCSLLEIAFTLTLWRTCGKDPNHFWINLVLYMILSCLLTFMIFWIDKICAQQHWWRILEAVLFMRAFAFGAVGAFIAMHWIRHKVRKIEFRRGVHFCMIFNLYMIVLYYFACKTFAKSICWSNDQQFLEFVQDLKNRKSG